MRAIVIVLLVLAALTIAINEIKLLLDKNNEETQITTEEAIDYSMYYTYDEIEEIVNYLADTEDTETALGRLIDPLNKSKPIDVSYIKKLVSTIGVSSDVYIYELAGLSDSDYVTKEQFDIIYHNIADTGCVVGLFRRDLYVFTAEQIDKTNGMTVISDGFTSYNLESILNETYNDKIIDVYIKRNKIFKINGYSTSQVVLENVLVTDISNGKCKFLYNNLEKEYALSPDVILDGAIYETATDGDATPCDATAGDIDDIRIKPFVASIGITNNGVTNIDKLDSEKVKVLSDVETGLQIENKGTVECTENFKIYNIYNNPECEESRAILAGYKNVNLYFKEGKIIAALIDDELISENIRVIISNDTYTSYDMKSVVLTCDSKYTIEYPDEKKISYDAGEITTISYSLYEADDVIKVIPDECHGKIQLLNINRSYGNPRYDGIFEINIKDECLHLINELPLEEYLYSVVSSEMPSSSPIEALKAMAICARGYAYTRMYDGSYDDYNAHLDDSTLCQMYNNYESTYETQMAVKDTYGIVPTYNNMVIMPLYFSTSFGTTCTNEEIWGGDAYPYLESNVEDLNKSRIDLSKEEDFIGFIKDSSEYNIIDRNMPYYRWYIDFTQDEMTEAVNSMLEERMEMSSDSIVIKDTDGNYTDESITDIGIIQDINIIERSKSGVVMTLEIVGSEAIAEITGQTNIRTIITPVKQNIIRQDDSVVTGWTSLPSPYYYVEKNDNGFSVIGGGFGHGAGMSQNGAAALAGMGNNYKYILRHYYSYIDFNSIYQMESGQEEE